MQRNGEEKGQVSDELAVLQQGLSRLEARVALLESTLAAQQHPISAATPGGTTELGTPDAAGTERTQGTTCLPCELHSDETVAAMSAAIAAYLGVVPTIRQIRLLRCDAWAQRGIVTIQASHSLFVR